VFFLWPAAASMGRRQLYVEKDFHFFAYVSLDEKNKCNEDIKTTIPSNNYDRPKTTGECGMF
jgi:hypothetical protein